MNIYLDIDGVLLNKDKTAPQSVVDFLKNVTENHSAFFLTTHCKGNVQPAREYLKRNLPVEAHIYIDKIQPTDWDVLKTDGIDFKNNFLWFDDYLMESEKAVLKAHNALEKQVLVDLRANPDFFTSIKL